MEFVAAAHNHQRSKRAAEVREDASFLRDLASVLSYNTTTDEAIRKHRLNEIAARIETEYYTKDRK